MHIPPHPSLSFILLLSILLLLPSIRSDSDGSSERKFGGEVEEIKLKPISPKSSAQLSSEDVIENNDNNNNNNNKNNKNKNDKNINNINKKLSVELDLGFIHAFIASLSVIIVSELGDKTFFIAAILSMRNRRTTVFFGSLLALVLMTILSAFLGYATTVIPRWLTYYVSCGLFALFGIKMLKEAWVMDAGEAQEEYEEVQRELGKKESEAEDLEGGGIKTTAPKRTFFASFFSKVFLQSFMLTFLAEWGDRSQIATIILAARDEVVGVVMGGVAGHALCTLLAVVGGRFVAQHISIKTVHFIGGIVFLIFALSAFFIAPEDH